MVSAGGALGGEDGSIPALAASYTGEPERLGDVPTLGQHSEAIRKEFAA